jgi:hypothetical protein
MKYQPPVQNYIVLTQKSGLSQATGRPYVTITIVGTKDRREYVTYVDSSNHNQKNWFHIINNPQNGFILKNLRTKVIKDRLLIDADSRPQIAAEHDSLEYLLQILMEVWAEQDSKAKTNFKELFE